MSKLVVIRGPSASGKTSLIEKLELEMDYPVICKDTIKEILFDTLGVGSVELSQKQGAASFEILFYVLAQCQKAKGLVILEANLLPKHRDQLLALGFSDILEVIVTGSAHVLRERFLARAKNERHPGHADDKRDTKDFDEMVRQWSVPLGLPDEPMTLDTTSGKEVYPELKNAIEKFATHS